MGTKTKSSKAIAKNTKKPKKGGFGKGFLRNKKRVTMALVAVIFMIIGGSMLYRSFAATTLPPCATGSSSLGYETAYNNGAPFTIRLCRIYGFKSTGTEDGGWVRVSSNASARWVGLFQAAYKSGITLEAASSFRSYKKQTELYNCYVARITGCNEATKPGYSNHQTGTAVDIEIARNATDPTLIECKANPDRYPVYKWLSLHAANYGRYAAVDKECWHWSNTGT